MDYKKAGVDVEAGYEAVRRIKKFASATMRPEVLTGLGGFSGAFSMEAYKKMEEPVLLSGTDGVGTKLKVAFLMDRHDTVGIDCVAMCVNDIACAGAEPLFFLDYIACGQNEPERIEKIVSGVSAGCIAAGAALIGGETAEMPGFYPPDEYDLAGFAVGIADKKNLITGENTAAGDVLIGIASSGIHSNGYSLVRSVLPMDRGFLDTYDEKLGMTWGQQLLVPTKIYVNALKAVRESGIAIHACSHITGGGFYENVPRMMPDGMTAVIDRKTFPVPPVFEALKERGGLSGKDMYGTFNMGLGMILCVSEKDADCAAAAIEKSGEKAYRVGHAEAGTEGVVLC